MCRAVASLEDAQAICADRAGDLIVHALAGLAHGVSLQLKLGYVLIRATTVIGETALMIRILRNHVIHAIILEATWMNCIVYLPESSLPTVLLELLFLYLLGGDIVAGALNCIRFPYSLIFGRKSAECVISLPIASLDPLKSRHFTGQRLGASKHSLGPVYWIIHLEAATPRRFRDR